MTESKTPATGRIIRQPAGSLSVVAPPTASGHTYLPASGAFPTYIASAGRAKVNQPISTSSTAASLQHAVKNPVTTQFQVPLQLGHMKAPLTVVTSYPTKQNAGTGSSASRSHPGIVTPPNSLPNEPNVKATMKAVGIKKVSYVKQTAPSATSATKPTLTTSTDQTSSGVNLIAQSKKVPEVGKPVLLGQGLRQPSTQHHFQHQVTQPNVAYSDTAASTATVTRTATSWVVHQQDTSKLPLASSTVTVQRTTKTPVVVRSLAFETSTTQSTQSTVGTNAVPHDLAKKHGNVVHQPKTTISISMPALSHIPQSEQGQRSVPINVPTTISGKPVYQIMTPAFPTQITGVGSSVKKLQTMIVTQVPNSTVNTVFTPNSVLSSGQQITVITCGSGITYVPAPTPPAASNSTSIPIAKVYPQQQPVSRISVTTTSSSRISIPVVSSTTTTSTSSSGTSKTPTNLLQVASVETSAGTFTVMTTQASSIPNIPVAVNKSVPNPTPQAPLLNWYSHPVAPNSATSNFRPGATQSNTITQNLASGAIRVHPHGVLPLQGATGSSPSILQVADITRGSSAPTSTGSGATGPSTPTMSPKPNILRRQRPDSSTALKKLSFPSSSQGFSNQRRDLCAVQAKPTERRSAPYHISRHKLTNNKPDSKQNEIAVMVQSSSSGSLSDKNEIKPVLANQVYGKHTVASNGYPLKIANVKSTSSQFPIGGKDASNQSFSLHSIDLKVKTEPGSHPYQSHNSVKSTESVASASQILHQYQAESLHSYAAESPQAIQHRIQASGQHIKTNTIFASPGTFPQQRHATQHNGRPKATHVIKPASSSPLVYSGVASSLPQPTYLSQSAAAPLANHNVNSYSHPRQTLRTDVNATERLPSAFEQIKKEPPLHPKQPPGVPSEAKPARPGEMGTISQPNHLPHGHMPLNMTESRPWLHINNAEPVTGLSPRKRPRKQTHVVSDVPPDVEMMEDEESTDDADECEDEPMAEGAARTQEISATPASKLPGNKPSQMPHTIKTEPLPPNKRIIKEENTKQTFKSESPTMSVSSESKPMTEYTDRNGVRYVASRKRPSVSVLNKLKPNGRSVANHFMHYNDIKVKDKKVTLSELLNDKKRLTGFNVARFALQLKDMVESEDDVGRRMKDVYEGLVKYKQTLLGDAGYDDMITSPSPGTPTSLSSSFNKTIATPGSVRRGSLPGILENGPLRSPSTPLDRRTSKVKEEITKIEEVAQANLQRCRVVSDQILDTKSMLLKSIDHRPLAQAMLEASSNQKSQQSTSNSTQSSKRVSKKKGNS